MTDTALHDTIRIVHYLPNDLPAMAAAAAGIIDSDAPLLVSELVPAMTWAQRLKRVFKIDIETCERCGGTVKAIACIEDPALAKRILDHLEHRVESNQTLPYTARAPPSPAKPDGT